MVTLIHEKNHINNYVDYYWQSTQEEYDLLEFKAYKCSVNSTTVFSKASDWSKQEIIDNMNELKAKYPNNPNFQ